MKISQVKILLSQLKDDLEEGYREYSPSASQKIQYKNLFTLLDDFLKEHIEFMESAYNTVSTREDMLNSLNYLETILNMKIEEMKEKPGKFLDSSREKLEKAGIAFENGDFDGASNKLNTCIELALKEVLDIPTTIKGINTSKILDIMISEKIGPVPYLEEVVSHVLEDNFVKHQGVMPPESRIVRAISATENLLNRLPDKPLELSEGVKEKLWSGVRKPS